MNLRTRIKFCGITSIEDAQAAVQAGADAIGLVFYPDSPRHLSLAGAKAIADSIPALVSIVGLFVNPSREAVVEHLRGLRLDLLQFHGNEDDAFCRGFDRPFMKAIRVRQGLDLDASIAAYPSASAILLDAWDDDVAGGTGRTFDWEAVHAALDRHRLVLAGGLDPDNVAEAIRRVRPFAVDVSSGIEEAPGRKSIDRMRRFALAVQGA